MEERERRERDVERESNLRHKSDVKRQLQDAKKLGKGAVRALKAKLQKEASEHRVGKGRDANKGHGQDPGEGEGGGGGKGGRAPKPFQRGSSGGRGGGGGGNRPGFESRRAGKFFN